MRTGTMGRVLVTAKIENLEDLYAVNLGVLTADKVRSIEVTDALVDTGATGLMVPTRFIAQLGLRSYRTRQARTAGGSTTIQVYGAVRLTIQGRDLTTDVMEVPDDLPVLIGQMPLEGLDFVVDPHGQRLIGNPDHGGQHMVDIF